MVAVLEAISGPITGRRLEVRGGSIVRIGRTGKSDYAIAEDGYLSGLHFSVECDGTECRIRDMGSSNGTFVNGSRITDQVVREGDSIVAGGSTFRVHVDLHVDLVPEMAGGPRVSTAPMPIPIAGDSGYSPGEAALLNALYAPGEAVFAVVDPSRDSRIPTFLDAGGEAHLMLGENAFLVALPAGSRLGHVLIKDGWGRGWGFYATSPQGIEQIHAHFASFVNMRASTGAAITLRFWDPRVLRAMIPVMPPQEAEAFLGPCGRILVEAEKAEMALELCRTPRGPWHHTVVLA
jgi:hypothetical protein